MNAWSHHWQVFRTALAEDRERARTRVKPLDAEFLPAALEVIEKPVSPTGRITAWILIAGLLITVAWAVFGRVDVVASAPGTIMPTGNVKLIQSPDAGVVRAIHVRNGDVVRKGQPLVDLDPTLSGADLAQAEKALAAAELTIARNRALADALGGAPLRFVPPPGTPADVADTQGRLIAAQLAEVRATAAGLSAARASSLADASAARAEIATRAATVPILDRQIGNMNRLDARGYAPGLRLLELQRQREQEVGEQAVSRAREARALSEARRASQQIAETQEQARRQVLADLAEAEADAILRREEVTKARQKNRFQRLVAPEDGTIQQLEVHTIGGVIEPARPLMTVVPANGGLEVEARILNKDIGFVHIGHPASVKLEAFPFTRYGAVPGRVRSISRDAVRDEKLGLVYVATVTLDRATIAADGRTVALTPGLAATVDIRTGTRRIISYLLSPLQSRIEQAGRER